MPKANRKDVTDLEARERARITAVEKCFADLVSTDHNQSDRIEAVCVGLAESERLLSEEIDQLSKTAAKLAERITALERVTPPPMDRTDPFATVRIRRLRVVSSDLRKVDADGRAFLIPK